MGDGGQGNPDNRRQPQGRISWNPVYPKGHKLLDLMEFYKKIWEPKQKWWFQELSNNNRLPETVPQRQLPRRGCIPVPVEYAGRDRVRTLY